MKRVLGWVVTLGVAAVLFGGVGTTAARADDWRVSISFGSGGGYHRDTRCDRVNHRVRYYQPVGYYHRGYEPVVYRSPVRYRRVLVDDPADYHRVVYHRVRTDRRCR
jgi:hypothetical protein